METQYFERLRAALEASSDIVYEWDLQSDSIVFGGPAKSLIFALDPKSGSDLGEPMQEYIKTGDQFKKLLNPQDLPQYLKSLRDHFDSKQPIDCEYRVTNGPGRYMWVHDRSQAEFNDLDEPIIIRGILRVINRQKRTEAELEYIASFDALTGHLNGSRVRDNLTHVMALMRRYNDSASYIVVGLDRLTLINEAFGYATADALIIAAAFRLEKLMRTSDIMGRVGGDMFGLILPRCSEEQMSVIANRVLDAFRAEPLETSYGTFHMTVSVGGICIPSFGINTSEVMAKAEHANREAKTRGRDCFVPYIWSESQIARQRSHVAIGDIVITAMHQNRTAIALQPVIDSKTGKIAFFEALLRIKQDNGELMQASQFIEAMEKLGMIRTVDLHVLEKVIAELEIYPSARIAMNISAITIADRGWLRRLTHLLQARPTVAERLIVEVTETAALHDLEEAAWFISTIRSLGCKVAIDDFGSGYTSFLHFKKLTVDMVKIDGAFVKDIANNEQNQRFVKNLLDLAEVLGLETVAECIESEIEANALIAAGVQYLQGYLYGKPSIDKPWDEVGNIASHTTTKKPVKPADNVISLSTASRTGA